MKKFILPALLLALTALTLNACIPAAFVAGAAGGVIVFDNRDTQTMVADRNIATRISNKLGEDTNLSKQSNLSATSFNRIVLLVGQTPTAALRDHAVDLVQQVPNIKRIYNEITVEPKTSMATRAHDSWITTEVKTELLAEKGLQSSHIKILTENGVVYMMGLVTRSQGALAANATKRIPSVQKVVKLFEYLQ